MGKRKIIADNLKAAMKQKQADKVSALRLLVAEMEIAQIAKKEDLNDNDVIKILTKEAKKRTESYQIYKKAGRIDLADKEKYQLQIIEQYLPQQMGEDEVRKIIKEMKELESVKDNFGEAMKLVMAKLKGKADGAMVARIIREEI